MAQDFVYEEGTLLSTGTGSKQILKAEGEDMADGGTSPLTFEEGEALVTDVPQLKSPVDIAITGDNSTIVYLNSLNNKVIDDPHVDEENGESEWKTVEQLNDVSLSSGLNCLAVENWNGPDDHGTNTSYNDPDNTNPVMLVFALRGADGNIIISSPDHSPKVDWHYTDSNPYGADYADPDFDDSGWHNCVYPDGDNQRVSNMTWQSLPVNSTTDKSLTTSDFFGADPFFSNHHTDGDPRKDAGWDDGYWFNRFLFEII